MVSAAISGLMTILFVFLVFHLLVLLKVVPYNIVWGGRLTSDFMMYRMVSISLLVNGFFLYIILGKAGYIDNNFSASFLQYFMWIMVIVFFLNSIGNYLSKSRFEKIVFTPVTILITIFSLILAIQT